MTLTDEQVAALRELITHVWPDELESACEYVRDGEDVASHLFSHVVTLDNALEGTSNTPEQYLRDEGVESSEEADDEEEDEAVSASEPFIHYELFDANGVSVEQDNQPATEAAAAVSRFVYLHGGDPDEGGRGAQEGRVEFGPARRD